MIVDTANVVKAAIFNGVDREFGRKVVHPETGKSLQVNGAEYGFDTALRFLKARLDQFGLTPIDMILVVEGPNSKLLRESIWSEYKAGRGKDKVPDHYAEFNKAQDMLLKQFLDLGARSCTQAALEADDVIAYLAEKLPSCVIISTDGDMQQCITDRAHLYYDGQVDQNRYGAFETKYTTLYKALVGDTSDNIKGAKGFGEKAFLDLVGLWGEDGLQAMQTLILQKRLEELAVPDESGQADTERLKALQRVVDDREGVYRSWALASMYPDKVNTWRAPLKWTAGMVKPATKDTHPLVAEWAAKSKIVHVDNFYSTLEWLEEILPQVRKVALDIETSGCDEGDEWLERKKKRAAGNPEEARDVGVDVLGHSLTGMGLTLGDNDQFSLYFTVDHAGPGNLTKKEIAKVLKLIPDNVSVMVHNASFELSIMEREVGEFLRDNGWNGFLPNVLDTRIMASYVDEEGSQSLKPLSSSYLGYQQTTYQEVTQGRRMNQMTAREVLSYGTDDTVCTAALANHFQCLLEIEDTFKVMLEVEQHAAYLGALAYNQGCKISMERLLELEREDKDASDRAWLTLRDYLMSQGWAGTVCPEATKVEEVDAAFIKDAYSIVAGVPREKDDRTEPNAFLETRTRTPDKLATMLTEEQPLLSGAITQALGGNLATLNSLIKTHFNGDPDFNLDSPVQCSRLMYDVMKLPVRIRGKVTDNQRAAGQKEGNPKADDYAVQWALQDDLKADTPEYVALRALQVMKIANTRRKLYYEPYRNFPHWKDGLVHSSLTQCGPITRRYSDAGPNKQQLPKNRKSTGEAPKFREVYVPHHRGAVIVSLDFKGQEKVIIGDYSQDPVLLACLVGDQKKDMHAMTGAAILKKKALKSRVQQLFTLAGLEGNPDERFTQRVLEWKVADYAAFLQLKDDPEAKGIYKALRELGKKTNFTAEYGAMAKKLSQTLLVPEDEAQEYLEALQQTFARTEEWKREAIALMHQLGYATTKMGARRHFAAALASGNSYDIGAAERQAVNFHIQGSAAEQTKLAMGRFWRARLCYKYDARFIGPIHDEVVFSVAVEDLIPFLLEAHALMIAPYGGMTVPIASSISFGLNFGEQIEVGESVDPAVINKVLADLFPSNDDQYAASLEQEAA